MTTGVLFVLLALVHIARAVAEGWGVATSPFFLFTTILAAAMSVWAWRVLRSLPRP